jgi:hypothetical protein
MAPTVKNGRTFAGAPQVVPKNERAPKLQLYHLRKGWVPEFRTKLESIQACMICGREFSSLPRHRGKNGVLRSNRVMEHDHRTGELRGVLCDNCNVGPGMFDDDPGRLARAIEYPRTGKDAMRDLENSCPPAFLAVDISK